MMQRDVSVASIVSLYMKTNFVATFCIIIFASICWWYWRLNRAYGKFPSKRGEVEYITKFILGKFPKNVPITSVIFQDLTKIAKQYQKEGFYVLWFFRPYLILFNKDVMKRLYAEPAAANKATFYASIVQHVLGNGLSTSNEDVWKRHRKLLNPAFYVSALKGKMHIFNDVAAQLVTELEKAVDQPTLTVIEILKKGSFNILAQAIFGLKLDDETYGEKLAEYFNGVHVGSVSIGYRLAHPWLYWNFALPLFSEGRKFIRARACVQRFTQDILAEMKSALSAAAESVKDIDDFDVDGKNSLTRILLEEHFKDPTFTIEDVQDHITTFAAGGYDTISYTLYWCLYELGLHPDVQEKAFKELEKLSKTQVFYDDLYELRYLECIIKESLRLHTTLPIIGRNLNKDIQWEDYTIPRGTDIGIILSELHRNPDLYPDPERFDPERFSGSSEISPWNFMPFAEGIRNCIGKKYAMMEMKVILAYIIRRFKFETLEKVEVVDWIVTLAPVKPTPFLFTLR